MSKVLYRTYRPTTFSQVSGQEHVVRTLQNQFASDSLAHAYVFTGPRGVGKTTVARLVAKLVNCTNVTANEPCNTCASCVAIGSGKAMDVYEIDAASHTGVENVRETVIDSVRFAPNQLSKKVYIIDEVHMLSASAFNALLKTIEEPPAHVLFILATTEIHKVPETIISRCQRFDFKRISTQALVERMKGIVKEEGVNVHEEVLLEIARYSAGGARDAESLLGQVLALGEKEIGMDAAGLVLPVTRTALIEACVSALVAGQAGAAITQLNQHLEEGIDLRHFVSATISWLRDRLLEGVAGQQQEYSIAFLHNAIEHLLEAERAIRNEQIPQLPVELAMVRIAGLTPVAPTPVTPSTNQVAQASVPKPATQPTVHQDTPSISEVKEEVQGDVLSEQELTPITPEDAEVTTVFDTVPVMDIAEVKRRWPDVYEQIKTCNATLPMVMRSCEVSDVDGHCVELGFEYALYADTVNQDRNRKLIEGVFEQVLGQPMRVRGIHKKQQKEVDETVAGLIQEFGGSMV